MPNVVIIHTHDTGRYIEPYGHPVETPNLQAFAEDGVLFRNAYCAGPTCSPSRGAMMSGQSPHSNGPIGLTHRGFPMYDHDEHLASFLSEHGYETVISGILHEAAGGERTSAHERVGYDRRLESSGDVSDDDEARARAAAEYLQSDPEDPFFMFVGLFRPHRGFEDPEEAGIDPDYVQPPGPLPDVPSIREDMAGYHATVRRADEHVGIVLDAIEETDAKEETVVIYTTDHGIPFGNMKCSLYDTGIGVSQIARFPEGYRSGEAVDSLVSHVDLFPTLCDYLDLPAPDYLEGASMLPILRGETDQIREEVFSEVTYHAAYEPMRCVRTERYKYIKLFDPDRYEYVPSNFDSRGFYREHDLLDRERDPEMLFDLYHDPNERDNLVDHPEYADVYDDLSTRLDEWMRGTDDPLLDGPVSKPPGAEANTPDGYPPRDGVREFEPDDAR